MALGALNINGAIYQGRGNFVLSLPLFLWRKRKGRRWGHIGVYPSPSLVMPSDPSFSWGEGMGKIQYCLLFSPLRPAPVGGWGCASVPANWGKRGEAIVSAPPPCDDVRPNAASYLEIDFPPSNEEKLANKINSARVYTMGLLSLYQETRLIVIAASLLSLSSFLFRQRKSLGTSQKDYRFAGWSREEREGVKREKVGGFLLIPMGGRREGGRSFRPVGWRGRKGDRERDPLRPICFLDDGRGKKKRKRGSSGSRSGTTFNQTNVVCLSAFFSSPLKNSFLFSLLCVGNDGGGSEISSLRTSSLSNWQVRRESL